MNLFNVKSNSKKGFTLIELLVVIAIIGLLATLSVIALNTARVKARDARRVSDIKQIQTALEMAFDASVDSKYPTPVNNKVPTSTYISSVPTNPKPVDTGCTTGPDDYFYALTDSGASYTLSYCLSNLSTPSGRATATPAGIR